MTELLTTDEYKQQIRNVSHEIRNHLSICDMYSQIIKKSMEKSGISNESINNAIECIQQSIKIIGTNLLDLKSLNSTCIQILDFENVINKSIEMSKAYTYEKHIDYEVFIKNTANIKADESKLIASIVNIIKNGIEAIELKGEISVLAEIKNDKGVIKISNNGKPIPKDKQQTIFNQGYTTKKTGSGLGLSICKRYLSEQNASLELTKSTKTQTTFEIKIPIEK